MAFMNYFLIKQSNHVTFLAFHCHLFGVLLCWSAVMVCYIADFYCTISFKELGHQFFFFLSMIIVFAPFIIMAPKRSLWDILFLLCFLLHHPDCCRVMYCYSTFLFHYYYYSDYSSSTHFCLDFSEMPWSNFMKPCRNIICHVKLCC